MRHWHRAVGWTIPLLLAAVAAGAWWIRAPHVSASLYELIGNGAERIPKFVRDAAVKEISIVVSASDPSKVRQVSKCLSEKLGRRDQLSAEQKLEGEALDFLRVNRSGLVAPEASELLSTKAGREKLARRAMRRLYSSPMPPMLGYADDPFGLADGFLAALMPRPKAETAEGFPMMLTNGETRVLIRRRLSNDVANDLDRTIAVCGELHQTVDRLAAAGDIPNEVTVRLCGAPIHAAIAAGNCRREIGVLTWFSLAVIVALSLFVFRSVRWLPLLANLLLVSSSVGTLVLVLSFPRIHLMTLVMGTTVLGLVVDYSFHWLLSPDVARVSVKKGLVVSFATTEISLVPLMLSSIPVLRQSSVFLGVALAAALVYVLFAYPQATSAGSVEWNRARRVNGGAAIRVLAIPLAVVTMFGAARCTVKTDVASLYRPPEELASAEQMRAAFGAFDFSAFPTCAERSKIAKEVESLYAEHGWELSSRLGLPQLLLPPAPQELLLEPRKLMDSILRDWTREALTRLGVSVIVLLTVLLVLVRRRALRILLPPIAAILLVAGALGWSGVSINLFHLLAAFLLLGMGIDYAVFLGAGSASAFKPSCCSMLTSVAGFGALAFVSFPVVQSFGIVLGVGLPLAFVIACLMPPSAEDGDSGRCVRTEHGASLLGMEILLAIYRILGLKVLHWLAASVGVCVWCCSPSVRRASPRLRKVLAFTQSLADKLVVMAGGAELPKVVVEAHSDADDFLADVRSGHGVFIISSHVGTIEVMTALGECDRTFHAWMDFERTGVFNRFYLRHAKRRKVAIHPISEFGMQTVFQAGDWIDAGDCLVMAGDRGEGAFRFAAAFGHPVYFVACLVENQCRYRMFVRRLPSDRSAMKAKYGELLRELAANCSDQHFTWGV